jgi:GTPase Era involved in 16S rRNA processing
MAEANEPILTITEESGEKKYNVNELSDEVKVLYNKLATLQDQHNKIVEMSAENQILQKHYIEVIKPLLPKQEEAYDNDKSENKKG